MPERRSGAFNKRKALNKAMLEQAIKKTFCESRQSGQLW
jgi:hypothetical protein